MLGNHILQLYCIQSNKCEIYFAIVVLSDYSWDGSRENLMITCSDIADTSLLNILDIWISYETYE